MNKAQTIACFVMIGSLCALAIVLAVDLSETRTDLQSATATVERLHAESELAAPADTSDAEEARRLAAKPLRTHEEENRLFGLMDKLAQ